MHAPRVFIDRTNPPKRAHELSNRDSYDRDIPFFLFVSLFTFLYRYFFFFLFFSFFFFFLAKCYVLQHKCHTQFFTIFFASRLRSRGTLHWMNWLYEKRNCLTTIPDATSAQERSVRRTACNALRSTDRSQLVSAPHLHAFKAFPHSDTVLPVTPPLPVRRNRCLNKIALDSNRSRNGLLSDLFIYGL